MTHETQRRKQWYLGSVTALVVTLAVVAGSLAATVAPVGRRLVPAPPHDHDVVDHDNIDHDDNGTDDYDIVDRGPFGEAGRARLRRPSRGPFLPCPPAP